MGNFISNSDVEHDCKLVIELGVGQPCKNCREQYMEERSKKSHQQFTNATKQTTTLSQLDPEYRQIEEHFLKSTQLGYKVYRIDKNLKSSLYERYEGTKATHKGTEKLLFHGTSQPGAHGNIFNNGFKLDYAKYGLLGKGIYFADDVDYSDNGFCFGTQYESTFIKTILVCKVLFIPGMYTKRDNIQAVFDDKLCFPAYIVYYTKGQTLAQ